MKNILRCLPVVLLAACDPGSPHDLPCTGEHEAFFSGSRFPSYLRAGQPLRVGVISDGAGEAELQAVRERFPKEIMKWVEAIRPASKVPLIQLADIQIVPRHPFSLIVFVNSKTGRSWYIDGQIELYKDESEWALRHEIGHAMGLADTYEGLGLGVCKDGFADSIMCNRGNLTEYDIVAARDYACWSLGDDCADDWKKRCLPGK